MRLTDVQIQCVEKLVRKNMSVYCDVTSHNLIPSRVIWGRVGDRDTKTIKSISNFVTIKGGLVSKNHLAVCNYEKETNSLSFLVIRHLFSPSDFPNIQNSANLPNAMTL